MATKLKNLKIKKVDFVDEGANPDAHIRLTKKKDEGRSAAGDGGRNVGIFGRLLSFIGKAAGMDQDEIDSAIDEIQKSNSVSFSEKYNEARNGKIADEIWDICYALQSSLCSILNDEELDSTSVSAAMQKSLDEFQSVMTECISQWSEGKLTSVVKKDGEVTEEEVELMKSAVARLTAEIEKANAPQKEGSKTDKETQKGEGKEMIIDKNRLTEAERVFLESIEKRYGTEEPVGGTPAAPVAGATGEWVEKGGAAGAPAAPAQAASPAPTADGDDIYKGIHPMVKAELESLKKFREEAEERELHEVAKKYEVIGKKTDELVQMLKSLKAAGGTAYGDMIAILDQTVEAVEKSGLFREVGKSGHSSGKEGSAEAKISGIAKGYMEKDASLSYDQAVAKAWEDHPELIAEYDEQEGF